MFTKQDLDIVKNADLIIFNHTSFRVRKGSIEKEYEPKDYFDILLETFYNASDEQKSFSDKIGLLINGRVYIQRQIKRYRLNKDEFSDLFEDIESVIKQLEYHSTKNDKWRYFIKGAVVTLLAGLIGSLPNIIEQARKVPQDKYIVLPKTQIVHDTVYMKKPSVVVKNHQ